MRRLSALWWLHISSRKRWLFLTTRTTGDGGSYDRMARKRRIVCAEEVSRARGVDKRNRIRLRGVVKVKVRRYGCYLWDRPGPEPNEYLLLVHWPPRRSEQFLSPGCIRACFVTWIAIIYQEAYGEHATINATRDKGIYIVTIVHN